MSGEELRHAAKYNDVETVRRLSLEKSNPCSTDEHGLTPLHYAVWNGHIECVKYLIMNPRGVTRLKERTTCINLKSSVGYTALHLAALECPKESVREITTFLLLVGSDVKLTDKNNRTAYNIAREVDNTEFLDVFRSYMDVVSGKVDAGPYRAIMAKLQKDYNLHPPKPVPLEQEEGKQLITNIAEYFAFHKDMHKIIQAEKQFNRKLNKRVTLLEREIESAEKLRPYFEQSPRIGDIPSNLAIHEHLILPVAEYGFVHQKDPVLSLHTLRFADQQAVINAERRRKLMISSNLPFDTLEPDYIFWK